MSLTLIDTIKDDLQQSLQKAFPSEDFSKVTLDISESKQAGFGDYQCNSAMSLAKTLGMSPRAIATKWVDALQNADTKNYLKIEIAGPGFINLFISDQVLAQRLLAAVNDARLGVALKTKPQRVVVDFSSPNVAKEMHVGHLRSTVIGDAIARVLEFAGDDVLRLNHIGDWGTAFGMLIVYLQQQQPAVLSGEQQASLSDLMQWYRASKQCFDADVDFAQSARLAVVALQGGMPLILRLGH